MLVSGGSSANMTALACARETLLGPMTSGAVAYVSDQGHSSFARAARLLGFRPDQLRVLPTDRDGRLRAETLAEAIDADVRAGRTPLFAAGVAGTTNTGAIDPLAALARVCRDRGVWFHVDGAYGGFAAITERGRAALAGIELADSVTLDPHKWLYQPFECGSLLVRDGRHLRRAFEIVPDYLRDSAVGDAEVNFADHGLQLSRGSRALKIWLSIGFFGVPAFRAAIDRTLDLALLAERHVRATPQLELMSGASLGIVTFRRAGPAGEDERDAAARNAALVAAFEATGRGLVSSTRLRGRYAIRMCVMNHTTAEEHVRDTLDWFARAPEPGGAPPPRAPVARRADPRDHVEHSLRRDLRAGRARRAGAVRVAGRRAARACRGLGARAARAPRRARDAALGRAARLLRDPRGPRRRRPRRQSASATAPVATSSASSRRWTGEPASATRASRPSPRPSRCACWCSPPPTSPG